MEPIHALDVNLKFETPANIAKHVASICFGHILAKMTENGRNIKHYEIISSTTSVKIRRNMSGIPH